MMKRSAFAIVLFLLGVLTGATTWRFAFAHPANADVAERFNVKRAGFERLRDMLLEDAKIRQVAPWGVRTISDGLPQQPPTADLSVERYRVYQSILSEIGAIGLMRSDGADADICVLMWASGWAGGAIHVSVCRYARDDGPLMSVASSRFSYFSLGDHWYGVRDDI
ncbi:hypothetical protein ACQR05_11610 [Bradyrhizobium oligotrophicum]|uniref:hypothetical protein n=1 Tax=Bradyrhizobium oligotrophicum TaxID=44255 RepID=UPI003EB75D52